MKSYVSHLFSRLDARSQAQLVILAYQNDVVGD